MTGPLLLRTIAGMATQFYTVTDTPADLVTAVTPNLVTGTTYSARYVGNGDTPLRVVEAATAPDATASQYLPVDHLEDFTVIPEAGENVYVWSDGGVGRVVINEV